MKKKALVTALSYDGKLLAVCRSRAKARQLAKQHVVELDYNVDRFDFQDLPLV